MIYTKTGDKGFTSLLGGKRVEKYSLRVEAYGSLDELNSFIGVSYDLMKNKLDQGYLKDKNDLEKLFKILHQIFNFQSIISCEDIEILKSLPHVSKQEIEELETWIDNISNIIGGFKGFVLPCGDTLSSSLHVSRSVCRRVERILYKLQSKEGDIDENILIYINRLSDYLFLLSRKIINNLGKEEVLYKTFD